MAKCIKTEDYWFKLKFRFGATAIILIIIILGLDG